MKHVSNEGYCTNGYYGRATPPDNIKNDNVKLNTFCKTACLNTEECMGVYADYNAKDCALYNVPCDDITKRDNGVAYTKID